MTPRQLRERAFYEEYARGLGPTAVSFEPVLGAETRPWNPAWFVYGLVRELYRGGARTLLEVGCGTGIAAVRFAGLGFAVTGVDLSPACIAVARENARRCGLQGRAHFETGVAERLDHPDGSVDVVVAFDVLHHVEVERATAECLRVLKPGGVAVFKEWVEVPVIDRLRRLPPFRWVAPVGRSIRREVTEDERKLTPRDLAVIAAACPDVEVVRFRLLARLNRLLRIAEGAPSPLERLDAVLLRAVPLLGRLGGAAVFVLRKPRPGACP